jgi:ATP-binding cassette subfamily D (ALD) protein 3
MLVKMAEALGRISLAGRELTKLAGYTERVDQLMVVLNDLNKGHYQRSMVNTDNSTDKKETSSIGANKSTLKPNSGKIVYMDNIIK